MNTSLTLPHTGVPAALYLFDICASNFDFFQWGQKSRGGMGSAEEAGQLGEEEDIEEEKEEEEKKKKKKGMCAKLLKFFASLGG